MDKMEGRHKQEAGMASLRYQTPAQLAEEFFRRIRAAEAAGETLEPHNVMRNVIEEGSVGDSRQRDNKMHRLELEIIDRIVQGLDTRAPDPSVDTQAEAEAVLQEIVPLKDDELVHYFAAAALRSRANRDANIMRKEQRERLVQGIKAAMPGVLNADNSIRKIQPPPPRAYKDS